MMARPSALPDPANEDKIRDAACVILIDSPQSVPTLLMGRRHADQVFLPDKWVFPGGRVEAGDRDAAERFTGDYAPRDLAPGIRPFAFAALRELAEETGLVIGNKERATTDLQEESCGDVTAVGYTAPALLYPLARAITPPGRVRRYDTWFFTASRGAVLDVPANPDGELLNLDWFTLGEARKLDLPNITRLVLEDVASRLQIGADEWDSSDEKLPFYCADACGFRRTLISCTVALRTP
jgi:8-oxo-dGTP pyrophosphatase MutT (NUDIX family)